MKVGETVQYRAIATFSDGSEKDVTGEAAWSVSDASVASIGQGAQGGLATGLAAGQTDVVASWQGLTGTAKLTVIAPVRLEVRPAEATIRVGEVQQYRAYLIWSDGTEEDVTERCVWVVADGTDFATPEPAKGLFRGKKAGRATVKAILEL
ncbi:Ig-like domain-containing protein [Desulfovirgula thermocuniculi]|uniref:Ig-like domain-containing protein n=1 Tax=Desulfovirgula thermocuniculi TaxID=348842 RepID=UPI000410FF3F|nr:Ig-like domain-containing protein [Desulfovirgula thermocuniculi]